MSRLAQILGIPALALGVLAAVAVAAPRIVNAGCPWNPSCPNPSCRWNQQPTEQATTAPADSNQTRGAQVGQGARHRHGRGGQVSGQGYGPGCGQRLRDGSCLRW